MTALSKRVRIHTDANINIVPYIDVVLVLLVVFMMATPIIEQGIEVDLALMNDEVVKGLVDIEPVIISINKKGYLYIGTSKAPSTPERVIVEIREETKLNAKVKVLIKPDKDVSIERYVDLLTFIQKNTNTKSVGMIGK